MAKLFWTRQNYFAILALMKVGKRLSRICQDQGHKLEKSFHTLIEMGARFNGATTLILFTDLCINTNIHLRIYFYTIFTILFRHPLWRKSLVTPTEWLFVLPRFCQMIDERELHESVTHHHDTNCWLSHSPSHVWSPVIINNLK